VRILRGLTLRIWSISHRRMCLIPICVSGVMNSVQSSGIDFGRHDLANGRIHRRETTFPHSQSKANTHVSTVPSVWCGTMRSVHDSGFHHYVSVIQPTFDLNSSVGYDPHIAVKDRRELCVHVEQNDLAYYEESESMRTFSWMMSARG
jgi:hypothetical protein